MNDKPMYCPMSLSNSEAAVGYFNAPTKFKPMECSPDCAWAVIKNGKYMCSIPYYSVPSDRRINSRPLDGDSE